jgi:opacity protein-like surface antigen
LTLFIALLNPGGNMKKIIIRLLVLLSAAFFSANADAHTIKEGTITLGTSIYNEDRNFDTGNTSEFYISVSGGYFVRENIEAGAGISYDHYRNSQQTSTSQSFSPYVRYHKPLDERSNIFGGVGLFFTTYDDNLSSGTNISQDSSGITITGGWEYFFNDNVSLDIGLSYSRAEWNSGGQSSTSDKENRYYWPRIGLRVFL